MDPADAAHPARPEKETIGGRALPAIFFGRRKRERRGKPRQEKTLRKLGGFKRRRKSERFSGKKERRRETGTPHAKGPQADAHH